MTPHGDDPQEWLAYGLALLDGVPTGIEGSVRQQQAALALQQAQRCGLAPAAVNAALVGWMRQRISDLSVQVATGNCSQT